MKSQIIFKRQNNGTYDYTDTTDKESGVHILASLLEEINGDPLFYIKNLKDKASCGVGGNLMAIEKEDDNSYIGYEYNDTIPHNPYNTINTKHLIELIDKWTSLRKIGYDEIILERDKTHYALPLKYNLKGRWIPDEPADLPLIEVIFNLKDDIYLPNILPEQAFGELIIFFTIEIQFEAPFWLTFLKDQTRIYKTGLKVNIEKRFGFLYLSQYPRNHKEKLSNAFKITEAKLISLINTWMQIIEQKPMSILFKKNHKSITIELHEPSTSNPNIF